MSERSPNAGHPRIDSARVERRVAELAAITDPSVPWSRTAFSELHKAGRRWLVQEMEALGLETRIDAGANLIGRLRGADPSLSPIATGSHSDTVPAGGRFDGAAGIVVAMEAVNALADAAIVLDHPLEVIDFLAEEPNQYGLSCIGSRAMSGALVATDLQRRAPDGTTLAQGIEAMGGVAAELGMPLRAQGDLAAFLELHIEQGRVLETSEDAIGVVTDIVGIHRLEVIVNGRADHSGATPMSLRQDALVGVGEMLVGLERRALSEKTVPLVATVGKLSVRPNAANVVPGQVEFTLEVRGATELAIGAYLADANALIELIAARRSLTVSARRAGADAPVEMNSIVGEAIVASAVAASITARRMPSGAGHDAAFVARLCPTGMIFVPSKDGRSHCPEEWTSPEQLAAGAQVLLDTLLRLDATLSH